MALIKVHSTYQLISSSCDEYFETITNLRDVISHCGGIIRNHPSIIEKSLKAEEPADPGNPMEEDTAAENTAK